MTFAPGDEVHVVALGPQGQQLSAVSPRKGDHLLTAAKAEPEVSVEAGIDWTANSSVVSLS